MCINFTVLQDEGWIQNHLGLSLKREVQPQPFPGEDALMLRLNATSKDQWKEHRSWQIDVARFGLIPFWVSLPESQRFHRHTYNARSESLKEKPSFKKPYRTRQWGVALMKEFFEPSYETGAAKRMSISLQSDEPFGVACLWDEWHAPVPMAGHADTPHSKEKAATTENVKILSLSLITLNADQHPVMSRMHAPQEEKRMPLVLTLAQFEPWLQASHEKAQWFFKEYEMPELKACEAILSPSVRRSKKSISQIDEVKRAVTASQQSLF